MNYAESGVNIDAGNRAVDRIKKWVKQTQGPQVLGGLGHFGAFFQLDIKNYTDPILVSCTDGVGTKLKLAIELGIFDTVGIDLVAMCVNDLICSGAKPLFFLDYIAVNTLSEDRIEELIKGMSAACLESGLALVGGEMAEMGDVYRKGEFDLAGFCVGVVDRPKLIDGSQIKPGQNVYGLASSGAHSNGFSLLRKVLTPDVCQKNGIDQKDLLAPTKLYVKPVQALLNSGVTPTGICHITGGGLCENIARILPKNVGIKLRKSAWTPPKVFHDIAKLGPVDEIEMFRVFNMGIGLVVICDQELSKEEGFILLGKVESGIGEVVLV